MRSLLNFIPFYSLIKFSYLIFKGEIAIRKAHKLLVVFLFIILIEPFRYFEHLYFYIKQKKISVRTPIFIIGHWRSGTTFLQHALLSHSNLKGLSIYNAVFPLTFITTNWLKKPLNKFSSLLSLENKFQRKPLVWEDYEEDDLALLMMLSKHSYYWKKIFGINYDFNSFDYKQWRYDYMYLLKKLSHQDPSKTLLLKSPPNTMRIKHILSVFPNAKFIYIKRDKDDVYQSMQFLWEVNQKHYSFMSMSQKEVSKEVEETYQLFEEGYNHHKKMIPQANLQEVSFEKLIKTTQVEIQEMWNNLGLKVDERERENLIKFLNATN